jgi:hypothetical protein
MPMAVHGRHSELSSSYQGTFCRLITFELVALVDVTRRGVLSTAKPGQQQGHVCSAHPRLRGLRVVA